MGREIRMVPKEWKHPTYINPHRGEVYKPLHEGPFSTALAEWEEAKAKWDRREDPYAEAEYYERHTFEEWHGRRPNPDNYMPEWSEEERTHLMMYENTSEGTPISPAFETPEELARWLTEAGASSFGSLTATYDEWLAVCKRGWSPSLVIENGKQKSGVEHMVDVEDQPELKIRLDFKTPDVADSELEDLSEEDRNAAEEAISKYVKYGEYVSIEVDVRTGTAKVLPAH